LKIFGLNITAEEFGLAIALGFMGYIFSTSQFLLFLNALNPIQGFIVYYIILYGVLYALAKSGLVIYKFHIQNPVQVFGVLLITFSFFVVVDWSSPYVQYITTGSLSGASNVFTNNAEDSLAWYFWTTMAGVTDLATARLLTFVLTPFVLTLLGATLVKKAKINV